jgi:hypothetical protein
VLHGQQPLVEVVDGGPVRPEPDYAAHDTGIITYKGAGRKRRGRWGQYAAGGCTGWRRIAVLRELRHGQAAKADAMRGGRGTGRVKERRAPERPGKSCPGRKWMAGLEEKRRGQEAEKKARAIRGGRGCEQDLGRKVKAGAVSVDGTQMRGGRAKSA